MPDVDHLLTFKETAALLENAPPAVWRHLEGRTLITGLYGHHYAANDFRRFIDLNLKLFGPGKNEL